MINIYSGEFALTHAKVSTLIGYGVAPVVGISPEVGVCLGAAYSLSTSVARTILNQDIVRDELTGLARNVLSCSSGLNTLLQIANISGYTPTRNTGILLSGIFAIDLLATSILDNKND